MTGISPYTHQHLWWVTTFLMLRKGNQRITTPYLSEKKLNRPISFKRYKVINSILYTNTKLYKIGFRTNDLCTFCDNQSESLTRLFYHCSRSKQFWIEFELSWCLISNQRIRLCLENVPFGILTENAFPLLQLLNYFIIIGKLYLWDCMSKQILPNIYGFRAKIIAKFVKKSQQQRIL